jgi:hypothetical protein
MEYSTLGKTGLKIPQIIFGTCAPGNLYRAHTYNTKLEIVSECIKNVQDPVFDSTGKYGAGLALETLGKCLRQLKISTDDILISNKLGWLRSELKTPDRRINFSQSFNGMAWVIGPLIGLYIYKGQDAGAGQKLSSMILPYMAIAVVVIAVAVLFIKTPLPEISEEVDGINDTSDNSDNSSFIARPLLKQKHFVLGVVAQFSYVAAQTGIFSYLINFVTDENQTPHFDKANGPIFLAIGFALFMIGRMSGSYLMRFFKPAGWFLRSNTVFRFYPVLFYLRIQGKI